MFQRFATTTEYTASACYAAAASSCANLSVILDAALLASIIFALALLGLHILGVLVALVSILRIIATPYKKPCV